MKRFLDTNVLVYAIDPSDRRKQDIARSILDTAATVGPGQGVVSTQVLTETYQVLTAKLGVDPVQARETVRFASKLEVIGMSSDLGLQAIDCAMTDRISIWDAGIVVCAAAARCRELITEDLNHGQVIRGVRIVNPFRAKR
jgi:predicted nucleic acid-binding protein